MPKKLRFCIICNTEITGYKFCSPCKENSTKEYQKQYQRKYQPDYSKAYYKRKSQSGKASLYNKEYYNRNKEVIRKKCRYNYNSSNEVIKDFYKRDDKFNSEQYHNKVIDNFIDRSKRFKHIIKDKIEKDPNYKIYLRTVQFLTGSIFNNRSDNRVKSVIGCSILEYKNYLESKFKDGMNWGNRGIVGWHIDHILPCTSFDLSNEVEFKKAFHFTNTQPMWSVDNIVKSNKV